jgi:hypothetical protein
MFCYYNTLAWEFFIATVVSVVAFATLPLVVRPEYASRVFLGVMVLSALALTGSGCLVFYLRRLAVRWINLPWEGDSKSPQAWIDYVEAGNWRQPKSPRAGKTYAALFGFIVMFLVIWFWFIRSILN